MKFLFAILLLPLFLYPAFAQNNYQQVLPSEQGTLNVGLSTDPKNPTPGDLAKLKIDFLNTKTNRIQEHIDYKVTVSQGGENVFGPIPLTHTSVGSVSIPVEFTIPGEYVATIEIEGILFQPIPKEVVTFNIAVADAQSIGNGCLIATASFGSELSSQVQELREVRDRVVLNTKSGTAFMSAFNQIYYAFSPTVADFEREHLLFKETVKIIITPLLTSLSILNYLEIDSEHEMLGYGIGLILLNFGMYLGIPLFVITKGKHFLQK